MRPPRGVCPVHGEQVGYDFKSGYGPDAVTMLLCSVPSRDGGVCNEPLTEVDGKQA